MAKSRYLSDTNISVESIFIHFMPEYIIKPLTLSNPKHASEPWQESNPKYSSEPLTRSKPFNISEP